MKKLIATILAASMMLSGIAVSAEGSDRVKNITTQLSDSSEIHILYNDTVIQYEDVKPVNTDGRVMIPFRVVLENMGAKVDYDDSQRLVTATKGDTTIKFTLMDDTIYINENGEESTIVMDTPMIIVEDRTLVPIRFMSNALGMQVGWDGDSQTVLVVDYDEYFAKLNEIMPNFSKVMTMEQPQYNKEYVTLDIGLDGTGENAFSFNLSGVIDSEFADSVTGSVDVAVDASVNDKEIKDSETNIIVSDGKIYLKTDLVEKIAELTNDEDVKSAALVVDADEWFSVDVMKFFEAMPVPEEAKVMFDNLLNGQLENADAIEIMKNNFITEGDATIDDVMALAMVFDVYEWMDEYIVVTETEDGYSVSMDITIDDLIEMVKFMMGGETIPQEEIDVVKEMMTFNISMDSTVGDKKSDGIVDILFGIKEENAEFKLTLKLTDTAEVDETVKAPEVPADSKDVTDVLIDALGI